MSHIIIPSRPGDMTIISRVICFAVGLFYASVGVLAFAAPRWFFFAIGPFGAFNAHYTMDVGAFTLPLGVGSLIASTDPQRFKDVIGLVALASCLHALSHFLTGESTPQSASTNVALTLVAAMLVWVWYALRVLRSLQATNNNS